MIWQPRFITAKSLYSLGWAFCYCQALPLAVWLQQPMPCCFFLGHGTMGFGHGHERTKIYGWYLMGCGIGLGLLSKYTMVFFYPCLLLYVLFSPPIWKAHQRHIVIALMISVLLFLPNVYWNWQHGFITLWHTAQISHLQQSLIHPGKFLEFFGAQFGVFGPLFSQPSFLPSKRPGLIPLTAF